MIDVLTLNYNDADSTIAFILRVKGYSIVNKIVVVDNHSTDDSLKRLQTYESDKIHIVESDHNGGYGAGNNLGVRYLWENFKSKYILLSNPDVIVNEDAIYEMEHFLRNNPEYVMAAPFMCNPKMEKQINTAFKLPSCSEYILTMGMFISKFGRISFYKNIENDVSSYKQVDAVSGSMFMMDTEKMIKYGMYDENIFLFCEETVLGLKLQQSGYKTALLPQSYFIHNHSVSISKSFQSASKRHKLLMKSKLYVIKNYYHANKVIYALACIMSKISLLETKVIYMLKHEK
jgi:GT2 family glycosyltransferase